MSKITKEDSNTKTKTEKLSQTTKQQKDNKKIEKKIKEDKSIKTIKTTEKKDTKKSVSKNTSTKKNSSSTKSKKVATTKSTKTKPVSIIEYYDLPYRYNKTIVKILAQTPQMLFVYWDISDKDRSLFINQYGDDFFSKTKPVLVIYNETMNYTFEVEINDFANSWYLQVNDTNCIYKIELGRRPNTYLSDIKEDYIYITNSNEISSPNDHVLFEKFNPNVKFKNIKTGKSSTKDFSNLLNYKNMKQIYNIYDLYKQIYKDELFEEIINTTLKNPSS